MTISRQLLRDFFWSGQSNDFVVGVDDFSMLQINTAQEVEKFYYFFYQKDRRLIKQFVLNKGKRVDYICRTTLIQKDNKFSPRLSLSVRDKTQNIIQENAVKPTNIKANVDLGDCYDNFWKLISFLQSVEQLDVPKEKFSLISQEESEIVSALRGRKENSIINIIKQLSASPNISLTQNDVNVLLKRRERLKEFEDALVNYSVDEKYWQCFFEQNKWIFGYGLNYEILKQQQSQPNYGGTRLDGQGGQRGDILMSTVGNLNFTVLVELKTPSTFLLQGSKEIRNGAWSLSKSLIDALSQIQANIQMWEKYGSEQLDNKDQLEKLSIFTVKPKGIIVIGLLSQLTDRSRRDTFQRFRKCIHGIDIITFDELFERAKFIVEND